MKDTRSSNANIEPYKNVKHRAYQFPLIIIKLVSDLPNKKTCWVIANQLLRSATSVGANLIEAKAASSKRDFIKFYEIALKSANETKYWLCLLRDSRLVAKKRLTI